MKNFELYSGTGKSVQLLDVDHFQSWQQARDPFATFGFWGRCTLIERAEDGGLVSKHIAKFR